MSAVLPRVELLAFTPEPLSLVYAAFRQCYSAGFVADMWPKLLRGEISREKQAEFVASVLASGHTSPVEHISFTFALSGISRALTHQLVRHRLASYSQQSQRYVDASNFDYIVPPSIAKNPEALALFEKTMEQDAATYRELKKYVKAEDARFVLPQAAATNIVVTMNARSLLHFFEERCCLRAQWEIRAVAEKMLQICQQIVPEIFANAGAKCERLGYCPEGEKFCCGRYPLLESNITAQKNSSK